MASNTQRSYASIAQLPPKKEQAIIIESHDGLTIRDYVLAVSKITDPSNIRYISRISNARICIYLSSTKVAETLTSTHPTIQVNGMELPLRPLLTQNKRIILSNVCPIIPNTLIEQYLLEYGVKPTSTITCIRAGISEPGFSHILSFRRQLFISPNDYDKLPPSIPITYEGTNYWIYLSSDTPTCFICKEVGHLAKHCKTTATDQRIEQHNLTDTNEFPDLNNTKVSAVPTTIIQGQPQKIKDKNSKDDDVPNKTQPETKNNDVYPSLNTLPLTSAIPNEPQSTNFTLPIHNANSNNATTLLCDTQHSGSLPTTEIVNTTPMELAHQSLKRPISMSSCTSNEQSIGPNNEVIDTNIAEENLSDDPSEISDTPPTHTKLLTKRTKKSDIVANIEELLQPIKPLLESQPEKFALNFLQLQSFFENTIGINDISTIALQHTTNLEFLVETLRLLHPHFTDRGIKNRSTRIEKKLLAAISKMKNSSPEATE